MPPEWCIFFLFKYIPKIYTRENLLEQRSIAIPKMNYNVKRTFNLCLLSLSQKLNAPSDPAVANVWCTCGKSYARKMLKIVVCIEFTVDIKIYNNLLDMWSPN